MRQRNHLGLAAAVPLLLAVSCVTIPERPLDQWLGVLPDKGTLYLSMTVPSSAVALKKSFADAGPAFADLGTIVDMTRKLYASVTMVPDKPPQFSAVALGSFPSFFVGMRLGTSADWKSKSSAAGSWFENEKAGLQVSVPADSVLVASTGAIESLLPRLAGSPAMGVPPEVLLDMEKTDIVLYLPELPQSVVEKAAGALRIPVKRIWLRAQKNGDGYEVGGTAETETEKDAKLFAVVMRIGLVAWLRTQKIEGAAERLSTVSVKAQGAGLVLSGLFLKDAEIAPVILSLVSPEEKEEEPKAGEPEKTPETTP